MDDRKNQGNQQDAGMEDRNKQQGSNMPDNQKKPNQGENQSQGFEDRNRDHNQGQQDQGKMDKERKSA